MSDLLNKFKNECSLLYNPSVYDKLQTQYDSCEICNARKIEYMYCAVYPTPPNHMCNGYLYFKCERGHHFLTTNLIGDAYKVKEILTKKGFNVPLSYRVIYKYKLVNKMYS